MDELDINIIRTFLDERKVVWSQHMIIRMQKRGITTEDVERCVLNGNIIEYYQNDYPHPSCLILGMSIKNEGLHVVCGIGEGKLWMITAYYPDLEEWHEDLKTRR
ncbi:MAG: DUF4258 domain-containing protein [Clostridiales bacterium]|jgi:hypothetical protein|nr:DUF4258 domain-containing protein [Eubacteriales bacterium]MDH7567111.1 DUF4258 domain-containing protein [Clostridiales bacterium]